MPLDYVLDGDVPCKHGIQNSQLGSTVEMKTNNNAGLIRSAYVRLLLLTVIKEGAVGEGVKQTDAVLL